MHNIATTAEGWHWTENAWQQQWTLKEKGKFIDVRLYFEYLGVVCMSEREDNSKFIPSNLTSLSILAWGAVINKFIHFKKSERTLLTQKLLVDATCSLRWDPALLLQQAS